MYYEELSLAQRLAKEAVSLYMRGNRAEVSKENGMGVYDIVTSGDLEAEDHIINGIKEKYPNDKFICEEQKNDPLTDDRTWVIDPIDGTVNYNRRFPLFGTQIVLMVKKKPVMSVIYLPVLDEMYTATEDDGARLNGLLLDPRKNRPLKECVIALSDFSRRKVEWREIQSKLIDNMYDHVARLKMLGAACCDFAFTASGKTDMHIRFVNNIWDFMPGLFLCRVAGVYIDEELLDRTRFLLMGPSKETCEEFKEKVIKDLL